MGRDEGFNIDNYDGDQSNKPTKTRLKNRFMHGPRSNLMLEEHELFVVASQEEVVLYDTVTLERQDSYVFEGVVWAWRSEPFIFQTSSGKGCEICAKIPIADSKVECLIGLSLNKRVGQNLGLRPSWSIKKIF